MVEAGRSPHARHSMMQNAQKELQPRKACGRCSSQGSSQMAQAREGWWPIESSFCRVLASTDYTLHDHSESQHARIASGKEGGDRKAAARGACFALSTSGASTPCAQPTHPRASCQKLVPNFPGGALGTWTLPLLPLQPGAALGTWTLPLLPLQPGAAPPPPHPLTLLMVGAGHCQLCFRLATDKAVANRCSPPSPPAGSQETGGCLLLAAEAAANRHSDRIYSRSGNSPLWLLAQCPVKIAQFTRTSVIDWVEQNSLIVKLTHLYASFTTAFCLQS